MGPLGLFYITPSGKAAETSSTEEHKIQGDGLLQIRTSTHKT